MNERVKFVAAVQAGTDSMAEVCRRFGISRETGYKYLHRYEEDGAAGLYDRASAPGNHPNRTPPDVEEEILRVRKARPTWGSKKIVTVLARTRPAFEVPARSTVDAILSRNGLVERRRSRQRGPSRSAPVAVAEHPNDGWSIDYKGWFRVGDGTRCDPLTLNDVATRMSLKLRALVRPRSENVRAVLTAAFREYGLPLWVLSDNGAPFGSTGIGGLTRLSVWFVRLGITPIFIQPGHPEQNGRHERFHLTLQRETASPPSATIRGQQVKFNRFQRYYNEERPHEALSMAVPASVYVPSSREQPSKLREFEYGDTAEVRRVRSDGGIKWNGISVFVGTALRGELVSIEPVCVNDWHVYLGSLRLGALVEDKNLIVPFE